MHELLIREACDADIPAILELYTVSGIGDETNFTADEAIEHLALLRTYPYFRVFVALIDEAVAGTYELMIMDNMAKRGRKSAIVEDVAVHPDYQGKGIGRAMMRHALEQCRESSCYKLTLSSNLKRLDAHRFYDSLGFTRHGYSFQMELLPD
ncbi:GNAT family N-acetyltransferase [Silvibacterium dinghuense]|uniref:GNAT family N-acetyltransferase n=1 Tax=Silvibacterium dinghuense TaxID=1560006 RepID=A0A4Q1SHS0_9BACT|nr:GNAT family N-acetyltransferase [Silvibacterium dinghuense]RXS96925.1 GNAT family N-acetyltransferase [Silvibacterium dinghuense]GGG94726.1 acetyltransferase [Silvibacterium dinghuense]